MKKNSILRVLKDSEQPEDDEDWKLVVNISGEKGLIPMNRVKKIFSTRPETDKIQAKDGNKEGSSKRATLRSSIMVMNSGQNKNENFEDDDMTRINPPIYLAAILNYSPECEDDFDAKMGDIFKATYKSDFEKAYYGSKIYQIENDGKSKDDEAFFVYDSVKQISSEIVDDIEQGFKIKTIKAAEDVQKNNDIELTVTKGDILLVLYGSKSKGDEFGYAVNKTAKCFGLVNHVLLASDSIDAQNISPPSMDISNEIIDERINKNLTEIYADISQINLNIKDIQNDLSQKNSDVKSGDLTTEFENKLESLDLKFINIIAEQNERIESDRSKVEELVNSTNEKILIINERLAEISPKNEIKGDQNDNDDLLTQMSSKIESISIIHERVEDVEEKVNNLENKNAEIEELKELPDLLQAQNEILKQLENNKEENTLKIQQFEAIFENSGTELIKLNERLDIILSENQEKELSMNNKIEQLQMVSGDSSEVHEKLKMIEENSESIKTDIAAIKEEYNIQRDLSSEINNKINETVKKTEEISSLKEEIVNDSKITTENLITELKNSMEIDNQKLNEENKEIIDNLEAKISNFEVSINSASQNYDNVAKIESRLNYIEECNEQNKDLSDKIQKLEDNINFSNENFKNNSNGNEQKIENLTASIMTIQDLVGKLDSSIQQNQNNEELKTEIDNIKTSFSEFKRMLDDTTKNIDDIKSIQGSTSNHDGQIVSDMNKQINELKEKIENQNQLFGDFNELRKDLDHFKNEINGKFENLSSVCNEISSKFSKTTDELSKVSKLEEAVESLTSQLNKLNDRSEKLSNENKSDSTVDDNFVEKQEKIAKALNKQAEKLKNIDKVLNSVVKSRDESSNNDSKNSEEAVKEMKDSLKKLEEDLNEVMIFTKKIHRKQVAAEAQLTKMKSST
ncbi:MAG: hypothetical protein MHPSP_001239 [Paramarteilia canceri]